MNEDLRQRNLMEGWCDEGEPFSAVVSRIDAAEWERIQQAFDDGKGVELRAAQLIYAFTGLVPSMEDDQSGNGRGRNGVVDALLTDPRTGERQVLEVTSSLDSSYQKSVAAMSKFVSTVTQKYSGTASWSLSLQRGWEAENLRRLAPEVADSLTQIAAAETTAGIEYEVHPCVTAWMRQEGAVERITVSSWNAGALNKDAPYLDVLSCYLADDSGIRSKRDKLRNEAARFAATRTHLFVDMASAGSWGGLLPTSPSYFTWGTFVAPVEVSDLWLEGGTGELYHWSREAGWVFHSMEK